MEITANSIEIHNTFMKSKTQIMIDKLKEANTKLSQNSSTYS